MTKELKNSGRRNFLRVSAAGAGALALGALGSKDAPFAARVAGAAPLPNHKRVVVVNMLGGNDGLNTLIPATGDAYTRYLARRPVVRYENSQSLALTGGPNVSDYRLHPGMPNLQALWNLNEVAFINKVGYPNANLSHFVSEDIWSYAARGGMGSLSGYAPGWVARLANAYAPTPMGVASLGVGRRLDFEGANTAPFIVNSVSSFRFEIDTNYRRNHELRMDIAQQMLAMQPNTGLRGEIAEAAIGSYNAAEQIAIANVNYQDHESLNSIQYPTNPGTTNLTGMGRKLRDIAMMIHGGFETRLFYTGYGGFDTHSGQLERHHSLLQQLDDALAVFRDDLVAQGVWDDVVLVVISEFGRRNFENGSVGTDHGHGNVVIVIGADVTGGVYGDDITGAEIDLNYLPYTTDFRDVYRHVLGNHLNIDPAPLFPESQPISNTLNII
jgi:uncharacterized protein (DUF1501 family)